MSNDEYAPLNNGTDCSFMDINLNDAQDLAILPENTEVRLEISKAEPKPEKHYLSVRCKITGQGDALLRSVYHSLFYPKPDDDAEKRNNKLLSLKSFFTACGLTSAPRDPEELTGRSFWAILGTETRKDGSTVNIVSRIVSPQS